MIRVQAALSNLFLFLERLLSTLYFRTYSQFGSLFAWTMIACQVGSLP